MSQRPSLGPSSTVAPTADGFVKPGATMPPVGQPTNRPDPQTDVIARIDNSAIAPNVNDTMNLPTTKPITGGSELPPYNSQQVYPYDSNYDSGTIDVFTGIANEKTLTEIRDRAVYDKNTLSYQPIADSGTGILFPDAVTSKTAIESSLRSRPSTFKGPQQLDIDYDNTDSHFERQINPRGWRENLDKEWYKGAEKGVANGTPFVGYPNPNYFASYTDAIVTHNTQNLSHAQLTDALRSTAGGDFDHNEYLNTVGSLLMSGAVPYGPASANREQIVQTDGGGVNGDPRLAEVMNAQYELDFNLAKRIQVADASNDPRFAASAPGIQYQAEQDQFARSQETQFEKIQEWSGIPTGYSTARTLPIG